jgi:hypothetical protein
MNTIVYWALKLNGQIGERDQYHRICGYVRGIHEKEAMRLVVPQMEAFWKRTMTKSLWFLPQFNPDIIPLKA